MVLTLKELKTMCKKYNLTISGTKKQLAQRIYNLRSDTMSKKDLKIIKDFLKVKTDKRKLKKRTSKKRPSKRTKKSNKKKKKSGVGLATFNDILLNIPYFSSKIPEDSPVDPNENIKKIELEKYKPDNYPGKEIVAPNSKNLMDNLVTESYVVNSEEKRRKRGDVQQNKKNFEKIILQGIKELKGLLKVEYTKNDLAMGDITEEGLFVHIIIKPTYKGDDRYVHIPISYEDLNKLNWNKLMDIFNESGGFLSSNKAYQYENPSGTYVEGSFYDTNKGDLEEWLYDQTRYNQPGKSDKTIVSMYQPQPVVEREQISGYKIFPIYPF